MNLNLIRFLPSLISFSSIFSGFLAFRSAFFNQFSESVTFLVISCILDLLDGRVARYYNVSDRNGVLVDSFCDFANFGIICSLIVQSFWNFDYLILISSMIFTVVMALRLIRFSLNPANETFYFNGVPSPISGILFIFPVFFLGFFNFERNIFWKIVTIVYSLFVSFFPYSSLKMISNKSLAFLINIVKTDKEVRLFLISGFIFVSFISIITLSFIFSIYLLLFFYVLLSVYIFYYRKFKI